ncbi:NTP transferase domain-containing protein [Patescibacteria group bacterium]|nr:NTP transferase domain-containing protein [Patescibacteria group bacterium]
MGDITKAVIPIAGRGTRFLPLSKVVPKELFPLGLVPLIHHAVEEAKASGVKEIIFITNSSKRGVQDYFKRSPSLEQQLRERGEEETLAVLEEMEKLTAGLTISAISDPQPLGDGHAILQAAKKVGSEPCFVFYPDDVLLGEKEPVALQLQKVFATSQRPVFALSRVAQERVSSYGIVEGSQVTNRVLKLHTIVEKPSPEHAPSNFAVVGRSIITPEVFAALKKRQQGIGKKELRLTEAASDMVKDGKVIYGYEFRGRWLECGDRASWLRSFLLYVLLHPEWGGDMRAFLKENRLL